ncbi:MAG: hypothetical protein IPK74_39755 [Deltaproteobacteria bacterium]|nr:hypothetical protein [Deltaproteobacteria bacterium]
MLAEHATARLADAPPLLDAATSTASPKSASARSAAVAEHVLQAISELLGNKLPRTTATVAHVYNASFKCEDDALRLAVLEHVMVAGARHRRGPPSPRVHPFAFNNACVLTHAMKDYPKALAIAEAAQRWAEENPHIFHGAALCLRRGRRVDKAMIRSSARSPATTIDLDKLEQDTDLGELRNWPRFIEQLAERRVPALARAEPVREITADAFFEVGKARAYPCWSTSPHRGWPMPPPGADLDRLAQSADGNYRIVKVDIDARPELAQRTMRPACPRWWCSAPAATEVARTVGLSQRDELQAPLAQAHDDA